MSDMDQGRRQIPTVWDTPLPELPTIAANFFNVQVTGAKGPEEVVLSIGYAAPPVLSGTAEEQQAQVRAMEAVVVKPVVRLTMTPGRLRELLGVLQTIAANLDGTPTEGVNDEPDA